MAKKKEKIMTMRLSAELERRIAKVAGLKGVSASELVRSTLESGLAREERIYTLSAYERLKPWIGSVDSGKTAKGPVTSEDASGQVKKMVIEKWRRRYARRPS